MARVVETPHPPDDMTTAKLNKTNIDQAKANDDDAFPTIKTHVLEPPIPLPPCLNLATEDSEIVAALKLIAASVAQQRQQVAKHLIFHTLFLVPIAAIILLANKAIYEDPSSWLYTIVQAATALSMVLLILKRLVDGYLDEATGVGTLKWLYGHDPSSEANRDNEQTDPALPSENGGTFVLVYRFKKRIIGALVLSTVSRVDNPDTHASAHSTAKTKTYEAFIRAWTVQSAFRSCGVGGELLNTAVQLCHWKGWQGPRFANAHANSLRVLPRSFHGNMDRESELWSSYLRARIEANTRVWVRWEVYDHLASTDDMLSGAIPGDGKEQAGDKAVLELRKHFDAIGRERIELELLKAVEAQNRWSAVPCVKNILDI
ncbi:uncharacterized protein N7515_006108 [Penicillium bovifimosum]|uniref:Uncharacterized protein n=1 Tax=Penicillium bovifimosum TaxID=126998 RepID=A0A9W9L0G6_9EURO|nr:uncharacterized protein N7515_006108 [Penicillium bovifimosum]KAJ5130069.1 hypothetical protein N7515_006108 [Penicillium bovifimosum]